MTSRLYPDEILAWVREEPGRRVLIAARIPIEARNWAAERGLARREWDHITDLNRMRGVNGDGTCIVHLYGAFEGPDHERVHDELRMLRARGLREVWDMGDVDDLTEEQPWMGGWGTWLKMFTQDDACAPGEYPIIRSLLVMPDEQAGGARPDRARLHVGVALFKERPREWPPQHAGEVSCGISLDTAQALALRRAIDAFLNHERVLTPEQEAEVEAAARIRESVEAAGDPWARP